MQRLRDVMCLHESIFIDQIIRYQALKSGIFCQLIIRLNVALLVLHQL